MFEIDINVAKQKYASKSCLGLQRQNYKSTAITSLSLTRTCMHKSGNSFV